LLACAPPLAANAKTVPHKGWTFFYPTAVVPTNDPLVVKISYAAEGVASHLGRFTEVGEYSLHFNALGTPLFITDVIATRTKANEHVHMGSRGDDHARGKNRQIELCRTPRHPRDRRRLALSGGDRHRPVGQPVQC